MGGWGDQELGRWGNGEIGSRRNLPAAPEPAATVREHGGRMRGE